MTMLESVYCPFCGTELYEIDMDDPESWSDKGRACPEECGWIEVEMSGESVAVTSSPCTY